MNVCTTFYGNSCLGQFFVWGIFHFGAKWWNNKTSCHWHRAIVLCGYVVLHRTNHHGPPQLVLSWVSCNKSWQCFYIVIAHLQKRHPWFSMSCHQHAPSFAKFLQSFCVAWEPAGTRFIIACLITAAPTAKSPGRWWWWWWWWRCSREVRAPCFSSSEVSGWLKRCEVEVNQPLTHRVILSFMVCFNQ